MENDPAEVVVIKESFLAARIINNVRVVENGERALEYLHRRGTFNRVLRPDLLLLDWSLPEMRGPALLTSLRADGQFAGLPVAVLSDREDRREVEQAQALKADWFIAKPIDAMQLVNLVSSSADLWLCMVAIPDSALSHKRRSRAPR